MFRQRIDEITELRQLDEEQALELRRLVDRNREYLREWLPRVDASRTTQDSRDFLREARRTYRETRAVTAGIWRNEQLTGVIGLNEIDWANRSTKIGYWLDAGHQGKGTMTRASEALVQHAFTDLEFNRVEIEVAVRNTSSRAIPERQGFTFDGIRREAQYLYGRYEDIAVYGMTAAEWRAREQQFNS